jgi:putative lipoprotein
MPTLRPLTPVVALVVALVMGLAATLPARPATAADSANADPWFGRDKLVHFEAAGSLAIVGYANAAMLTENRPARAAAGAALAVGAGAAKERWDLDGHGDASWRDFGWDLIGAAAGVLVSLGTDWLVHWIFQPPPGRTR